jgi:hypothetical protein
VLRGAVSLFWLVFLADGILSLADATLAGVFPFLTAARGTVALLVLAASIPMAGLVGATPHAPKRTLIPLILFAWWAGPAMAFPLGLWDLSHLALTIAIIQVLVALFVGLAFHRRRGELSAPSDKRAAFSWRYLLIAGPTTAVLFCILVVSSALLGLATHVELLTGGYVQVRPDGVYLVERKFQSGDREVRLTGMMHVARREFYSGLLAGVDPEVPSVVLVEGVTDRRRLLGGHAFSYEPLARLLNLTPQSNSAFSEQVLAGLARPKGQTTAGSRSTKPSTVGGIDFRHADVDVESFHPETVAFILAIMALFQSADFQQLFTRLVDPASPITDEDAQAQVIQDILFARNRRLASEIESSLKDYRRVIVPWGAMHLPEIESWLQDRKFVVRDEIKRKALAFW